MSSDGENFRDSFIFFQITLKAKYRSLSFLAKNIAITCELDWGSQCSPSAVHPGIATELLIRFSLIGSTVITPTHLSAPALKSFLVGKSVCLPMIEVHLKCLLLNSPVVFLRYFVTTLLLM